MSKITAKTTSSKRSAPVKKSSSKPATSKSASAKSTSAVASAASKKSSVHPPFLDMIKEGIATLQERAGTSRQTLKKYLTANYKFSETARTTFDKTFNRYLRQAVEAGHLVQPKGPSGPVKIAKKGKDSTSSSKPASISATVNTAGNKVKKEATAARKTVTKKVPSTLTDKKSAVKKTAKKVAASNTKAVKQSPATKKVAAAKKAASDAVQPLKSTVMSKTKSGRVSKSSQPSAASTAAKKAAKPRKKATTVEGHANGTK